jgi:hypothetical protein
VTGSIGATGGINLTVIDMTYYPSDFTTYGTYGQAQYRSSVTTSIPAITQDVYDAGMVLVYYQGSGTTPPPWYSLPQTLYETNYSYTMTYASYLGGVNVQLYPSDLMSAVPNFNITVKIIVVPPYMGKTSINVDWKDYNAVKAYFNLKD